MYIYTKFISCPYYYCSCELTALVPSLPCVPCPPFLLSERDATPLAPSLLHLLLGSWEVVGASSECEEEVGD